jgi:ribosomal protein L29
MDQQPVHLEALRKELTEAQAALRTLRAELSAHQLTRVRKVRDVRRQIARLHTRLNHRHAGNHFFAPSL